MPLDVTLNAQGKLNRYQQELHCKYESCRSVMSSLLKKNLEIRLFVERNMLGDCQLQENTMGSF